MKAFATIALTALSLGGALVVCGVASAQEMRSKESCTQLFHRLNTSGTGKLTLNEASQDVGVAKTLDDPNVWRNGYLTEDEFTPLCMQGPKDKK